jgi:probable F420-dependent oxidoreductase
MSGTPALRSALVLHTERMDLGAEFVSAEGVMVVAGAAERAGFDAVAVTDHPMPEDGWMRSGGHHALDPFVALSFAAAATGRLRLLTYVYVLPYRNPFLSAKAAASLDALSGGRLIFGVAAGYLEPEFRALGVSFAERNELADEALRAMKAAWTEEGVHFEGRHFTARGHTQLPRPAQRPHPPIWVGGNSRQAIRRAVELGDGWMPIFNPPQYATRRRTPVVESAADIRARLAYARDLAAAVGRRAPLEVAFTPRFLASFGTPAFERQRFLDHVGELRAAGVTYFCVNLPGASRAEQLENIARFGEDVLARG